MTNKAVCLRPHSLWDNGSFTSNRTLNYFVQSPSHRHLHLQKGAASTKRILLNSHPILLDLIPLLVSETSKMKIEQGKKSAMILMALLLATLSHSGSQRGHWRFPQENHWRTRLAERTRWRQTAVECCGCCSLHHELCHTSLPDSTSHFGSQRVHWRVSKKFIRFFEGYLRKELDDANKLKLNEAVVAHSIMIFCYTQTPNLSL